MSASSSISAASQQPKSDAASATAGHGASRARSMQSTPRQLSWCKELFFAGFPCSTPYEAPAPPASSSSSSASRTGKGDGTQPVRPLSKAFVRGFFQQYGPVEAVFYDVDRGMGSVVFADGADAESCYLAVHLSFLPTTTAEGGLAAATWEVDKEGEALDERQSRPSDVLLCLEFAHCCPFVHPVLLTREVFLDGGGACCEVPGVEVSRAVLFHRFPQLLQQQTSAAAAATVTPVAPHVVVKWVEEKGEPIEKEEPRVTVLSDSEEEEEKKERKASCAPVSVLKCVGPSFPGRGIEPIAVGEALWRLLRPPHISPAAGRVVTVMDLWWSYYHLYGVRKTQPAAARIRDIAFRHAQRRSIVQEMLELQKQSREYAHGDDSAARQVLHRLVYDTAYHNVFVYLLVKQKFRYDPSFVSLMRDVYSPAVRVQVEGWQALMVEKEEKKKAEGETQSTSATANSLPDSERRRQRVVIKALEALHEPAPVKAQDIAVVEHAESTWLTMPRTTSAAFVMENVQFLGKIHRHEVDRSGHDKDMSARPPLPSSLSDGETESDYPVMSARQKEEQAYQEVLQTIDGYVGSGTAEELVAVCEDPKLFRYAKGHIGYEEVRRQPSYWRAYINALWVPLIALLLLGFGTYYTVKKLGFDAVDNMKRAEAEKRRFHAELRHLLEQQQHLINTTGEGGSVEKRKKAVKELDETMRRASEAAARAGGKFNIELRGDL